MFDSCFGLLTFPSDFTDFDNNNEEILLSRMRKRTSLEKYSCKTWAGAERWLRRVVASGKFTIWNATLSSWFDSLEFIKSFALHTLRISLSSGSCCLVYDSHKSAPFIRPYYAAECHGLALRERMGKKLSTWKKERATTTHNWIAKSAKWVINIILESRLDYIMWDKQQWQESCNLQFFALLAVDKID